MKRRALEHVALALCFLACLCAENIPLMSALIISAAICEGLNSQAIQNLRIRKPPLMLRASRAAKQNRRRKNNLSTAIMAVLRGKVNYEK